MCVLGSNNIGSKVRSLWSKETAPFVQRAWSTSCFLHKLRQNSLVRYRDLMSGPVRTNHHMYVTSCTWSFDKRLHKVIKDNIPSSEVMALLIFFAIINQLHENFLSQNICRQFALSSFLLVGLLLTKFFSENAHSLPPLEWRILFTGASQ